MICLFFTVRDRNTVKAMSDVIPNVLNDSSKKLSSVLVTLNVNWDFEC